MDGGFIDRQALELKARAARALERLLAWWDRERRALPWRSAPGETADPYRVWLSEILLQQTTVATASPYYEKFVARWPSVQALAAAEQAEVVDAFAGLGYYSRARSLHACAQRVAASGGAFPSTPESLKALPGIGDYTANAIAAIAFGRPVLPIDGNIRRVLARFFALERPDREDKARFSAGAHRFVRPGRPGDVAQALMDLGATVCRPTAPKCDACPLREGCAGAVAEPERFPARPTKAPRPLRHGAAFFAHDSAGHFLVRRRPASGLLGGLLELPGTIDGPETESDDLRHAPPVAATWVRTPGAVEQVFTHFTLRMRVYRAAKPIRGQAISGFEWVASDEEGLAKLPGVMRKAARMALDMRDDSALPARVPRRARRP